MGRVLDRLEKVPRALAKLPSFVTFVTDSEIGRDYGIGFFQRLRLVRTFRRNVRQVETLSSVLEHLELAGTLLRMPRSIQGDVIECGCYKGGSSVNLSLVCEMVGRRLIICDSFQGLPEPEGYDASHAVIYRERTEEYREGQFAASLDAVKDNLARFGSLGACELKVGFFDESLAEFNDHVVMAFLDVDLIDSLKPCLKAIWPMLADGGRLYVHEAEDLTLVATFFDRSWWGETIGGDAPGFVGAGSGLPLAAPGGSEIGYAQKGAGLALDGAY
jgi:O-methyltransferase